MFEDEFGENGNNDDQHEDLAILFSSSDIVIGEEIELSEGGNRKKKIKYEVGFEGNTGVPSELLLVNKFYSYKFCDFCTEDLNKLKASGKGNPSQVYSFWFIAMQAKDLKNQFSVFQGNQNLP